MNSLPERAPPSRPCQASPPARSAKPRLRPPTRSPASPTSCSRTTRRTPPASASTPARARRSRRASRDRSAAGQQGDREARRRAPGAPQDCRCRHARRGRPHRPRRRAHGARDRRRGLHVSLWRRRAPELELVLAQRALRGRAEHRRLPRDPEPARGAAHRRDPRGRRRLSRSASWPMPASSTARPDA